MTRSFTRKLLVVLGPTASGKTALAVRLARCFHGEIWSADSRQVYRGLDIGTGKDLAEYRAGGSPVRHHLIDVADPSQEFSVFDFQKRFFQDMQALAEAGSPCLPILAGGTGLYLEAAIKGYRLAEVPEDASLRARLSRMDDVQLAAELRGLNPKLHNRTDLEDRGRLVRAIEIACYSQAHPPEPGPAFDYLILGLAWDRAALRDRIWQRLQARMQAGMIGEVEQLHTNGVAWERLERLGLEYRYVSRHLQGLIPSREALAGQLLLAIADFAKRQMTWFRRMERQGFAIHWLKPEGFEAAEALVQSWLGMA